MMRRRPTQSLAKPGTMVIRRFPRSYNILRARSVSLGKRDYQGRLRTR
jgi:hypothetical protein